MGSEYEEWDQIYRKYPLESLGWELGRPRQVLIEFVEKGLVKKSVGRLLWGWNQHGLPCPERL